MPALQDSILNALLFRGTAGGRWICRAFLSRGDSQHSSHASVQFCSHDSEIQLVQFGEPAHSAVLSPARVPLQLAGRRGVLRPAESVDPAVDYVVRHLDWPGFRDGAAMAVA